MTKYVVLYETFKDGELDEAESLGFFDTKEEADKLAQEKFEQMSDDELKDHDLAVGEVDEKNLAEAGVWDSFTEVEVLTVYEGDEE
ncbi:hypothetical protein [Butyrivibrio sp. VCD2006]|uniref:hypothetical protein n=1 Tax=Butyrivibrio sp. VCD2006 TaxID=1280664 RepID=UPI000423432F|nr:hypothetical protein [Butyrivibrio sp. VCD2006]